MLCNKSFTSIREIKEYVQIRTFWEQSNGKFKSLFSTFLAMLEVMSFYGNRELRKFTTEGGNIPVSLCSVEEKETGHQRPSQKGRQNMEPWESQFSRSEMSSRKSPRTQASQLTDTQVWEL